MSVVGFDNILLTEVLDPALTTIAAPLREAGATGVAHVLALAAGAESRGHTLVLPVRLVERQSTCPPRSREVALRHS